MESNNASPIVPPAPGTQITPTNGATPPAAPEPSPAASSMPAPSFAMDVTPPAPAKVAPEVTPPTPPAPPTAPEPPAPTSPSPEAVAEPTPPTAEESAPSVETTPAAAPAQPAAPIAPGVPDASTMFQPDTPLPPPSSKAPRKKLFILGGAAAVLVAVAALYFGYYSNPSVVLSQSLSNSGKGYKKLVSYVDTQAKAKYKGSTGSGTYTVKSGSTSTDGSFSYKSDGTHSDTTFDVGLGVTRVKAEAITTTSASSKTPDIYLKASGIKGLGGLLGEGDDPTSAAFDKLDGKWLSVDHTLLDNLASTTGADPTGSMPTEAQIVDALQKFGEVNQQYVFTTKKDKAVALATKKYGSETVDGHKTYHYTMTLNKANMKKYLSAQKAALKSSKLNAWIEKNKYQSYVDDSFKSLNESANSISSKDTFDMWVDAKHRIVYKIRVNGEKDVANNYTDIGLDYKGGKSYPFFIAGKSKEEGDDATSGSLVATLDSKANDIKVVFTLNTSGTDATKVSAKMTFKPSNEAVKVTIPKDAMSLSEALNSLGLGDLLTQSIQGGIQAKAEDTKRQTDIQSLQTQLEAYFSQNGFYPSLKDMNSSAWLSKNIPSLDQNALQDPSGTSKTLAAAPAAGVYSYAVTDSSGKSCETNDTLCAKYTLTATFSEPVNGASTYTKSNLD